MAYLKMPGDHAVIFRKDVPIQGFTALWARTPGVAKVCTPAYFDCVIYT